MNDERFNRYRIMWIMVQFDLPTETKLDRQRYTKFRKFLLKDGYSMFQFSIYVRHCMSLEHYNAHIRRVKNHLPPRGKICIMHMTDKQFGMIHLYQDGYTKDHQDFPKQMELFE